MVPVVHWRPLEEIQGRSGENHSSLPEPPGNTVPAAGVKNESTASSPCERYRSF